MRIEESNQQVSINHLRDQAAVEQTTQQNARQADQNKKTAEADKLSISQTADSISNAASDLKGQEQFRADRVNELKAQVETGSYNVNSKDVAEKMIAKIGSFVKGASA